MKYTELENEERKEVYRILRELTSKVISHMLTCLDLSCY